MHVIEVLNKKLVGGSVESLGHVDTSHEYCMGFGLVKIEMSIVEELDKIVGDGRSFKTSTLARIKKRIYNGQEPVSNE